MLFDLFSIAKVVTIFEYPNKILLFIENLCCCSLKIAVCVLKITIISKNCRLKITEWSKNYGLKIPVRVRIYARMYARAYDCQDSTSDTRRTHTNGHTTGTQDTTGTHHRKREDSGKQNLLLWGDLHSKNKKKLKKVCKYGKSHYLCSRNQTTNKFNYKITKQ